MHVDSSSIRTKSGKIYTRHLIRRAYRDENGKPRQETIANISRCSDEEIEAIKLALKCKHDLAQLVNLKDDVSFEPAIPGNTSFESRCRMGGTYGFIAQNLRYVV